MESGLRVALFTAPRHESITRRSGLNFVTSGNSEREQMLKDPNLWKLGLKSAYTHGVRTVGDSVNAAVAAIAQHGHANRLLAPMIRFGARLLREKLRIPLVAVHLYPMMFVSAHEPPLALPGFRLLRRLPLIVRKAVLAFPNPLDFFALPAVRAACARHGVRKPWSLWKQWWHSPDGVLALFPEWFAKPQPDWPHNLLQWNPKLLLTWLGARRLASVAPEPEP